ncbi:MAG: aldo/keto reductase [Breznakibacter sp.]
MIQQIPSVTLANGVKMPMLGFGTFKLTDAKAAYNSVLCALQLGYRHIDTAAVYQNEEAVGRAIQDSGIPRHEIFLVTKMWNSEHGHEKALKAFDSSLGRLGTDYVDLYLVHWPKPQNKETWKAFEKIYREGRAKAIGVSNFHQHHLEDLFTTAEIKPVVNQVEFHPYLVQQNLVDFCTQNSIQYEAWSPLMQGKIIDIPFLQQLSVKYGRSIAQIVLRWNIELGIVTIPKSSNPDRIKENLNVFGFQLETGDVDKISRLDKHKRVGADPDNFDF